MDPTEPTPTETDRIRQAIGGFLEERLRPKLENLKDDEHEARQQLIADHRPDAWIADAARRVGQIQQVSHALKFTHPSADGSSLSSGGNAAASPYEVGTHTIAGELAPDVVGNAAALDVYKFLRLCVGGRTLLERATDRDAALAEALSDDPALAAEWMEAFAGLPRAKGRPSSHKLAKQLYWPVDDTAYHLLAPLFSSPLAHAVYGRIHAERFSDEAKAAREAKRNGRFHEHGYREYRDLAIQSFGGSKPQNISQLNSERRGENYLLASVPPLWQSPAVRPPLNTETVFLANRHFARRPEVRRLTDALRNFLHGVADAKSNIRIRNTRRQLVADLCDQVLQMAAELRELEPGWSAAAECRLNLAEQCWLDPARCLTDDDFATSYRRGDWQDEVCLRFANWLNLKLQTDKTVFGGPEAREWQGMMQDELKMLREELDDE
ncbi:type I-F CRISPR-associated protein Csy1 [Azotobacter salinestris]|uniref:type I-F CRISPR-associated protein Csy1 n=1 Tax=Azotobacter salinestris TaxID=69964 RepID=UPI0032DF1FCA